MKNIQTSMDFDSRKYNKNKVLENINLLIAMYKNGQLGGEVMPEDARPSQIDIKSSDNYHFLTLPMALNYQRNSYKLWESAAKAYLDPECKDIYIPKVVAEMSTEQLRELLLKHKVGLQPNKHVDTWHRIAKAITTLFDGDVRNLFRQTENDIIKIKNILQKTNKKEFPYLSGPKICNYWLHVMEIYTPTKFTNREEISVAPDTHIIQGSLRLGIIEGTFEEIAQNRVLVSDAWKDKLKGTGIAPIDIHTPLWLWSKRGFPDILK